MKSNPKVEQERRNRIRLSIFAYAYEFHDHSIISDAEYDVLSRKINKSVLTGHKNLDMFFKKQFEPDTGMWIHKHPDLHGIRLLYERYFQHERHK